MEKEVIKRIFEFLEGKEQQNPPFLWKHKNNIPITKEDLIIKGDLNLTNTNITSLPEGLEVGGNLFLYKSKITSLPKGLKVGGYLDLESSKIKSLPKGLEVGNNLYVGGTKLALYSEKDLKEMIYPGFIKGEVVDL